MVKRRSLKVLALVLMLALAMSLIACNGPGNLDSYKVEVEGIEGYSDAIVDEANRTVSFIVNDDVNAIPLSIVKVQKGITAKAYTDEKHTDVIADNMLRLSPGDNVFYVIFNAKTDSADVTVYWTIKVKKLVKDVEVTELANKSIKTLYLVGEEWQEGEITATYNIGGSEDVKVTKDMVTGFDTAAAGKKTITITYKEKTLSIDIEVKAAKDVVTGIALKEDYTATYYAGEAFKGATLLVTYADNTEDTPHVVEVPVTAEMMEGFDTATAGDKTVTVKYDSFTVTMAIKVEPAIVSSIAMKDGYTKAYEVADTFKGATIVATYTDGTTAEVAITAAMMTGFDTALGGEKTVTVTYENKTTTFAIDVIKRVTSIALVDGYETTYLVGDSFKGAEIHVVYNDKTEEDIAVTKEMVTNFETLTVGDQQWTVEYGGKSATMNVNVTKLEFIVTGIAMVEGYKANYFVGDEFAGAKVKVTFADKHTKEIDVQKAMMTGFDTATAGDKTITVTFEGKTTTMTIKVVEPQVTNVAIKTFDTNYIYGEAFKGGVITATYDNGDVKDVTITTAMLTGFDTKVLGKAEVTITYEGKTAKATITVVKVLTSVVILDGYPAEYTIGDAFKGAMLKATYNDKSTEEIMATEDMIVSGFDSVIVGDKTITIKYKDVVASNTMKITVAKPVLKVTNIEFWETKPNIDLFEGYTFAQMFDNVRIQISYNDGNTKITDVQEIMVKGFDTTTVGDNKQLTVEFEGLSIPVTYNVKPLQIKYIIVNDDFVVEYNYNDLFKGGSIEVHYNDNTHKSVAITEDMLQDFSTTGIDEYVNIMVIYEDKAVPKQIHVTPSIEGIVLLEGYETKYLIGDSFKGARIEVTLNGGQKKEVYVEPHMVTNFDTTTEGAKTWTISYGGKSVTMNVNVAKLAITVTNIAIDENYQKEYVVGATAFVGGMLTVTYSNHTNKNIPVQQGMVKDFATITASAGTGKAVTIEFEGITTTATVNVIAVAATELIIKGDTMCPSYEYGTAFAADQMMTVKYNNGTSKDVTITLDMVTGFDSNVPGDQVLTIKYEGQTTTWSATIVDVVTKLEILPSYNKAYQQCESYKGDIIMSVTRKSGAKTEIAVTKEMLKDFDTVIVGNNKSITVEYEGQTTTFTIDVTKPVDTVTSISIVDGDKTPYYVGDTWKGATINVVYSSGASNQAPVTATMIEGFDTTTVGKKTITVTVEGQTVKFDINVQAVAVEFISAIDYTFMDQYKIGDAFKGGLINVQYNNGTQAEVEVKSEMIPDFDSSQYGEYAFTITYEGKTCEARFFFDKTIVSVVLNEGYANEYIVGDAYKDDVYLTINYDFGEPAIEHVTADMITDFDTITLGAKTFHIDYQGNIVDMPVVVVSNEIKVTSIEIKGINGQNQYFVGDTWKGGTIYVQYNFPEYNKEIGIQESMLTNFNTDIAGNITVTVTFEGQSTTFPLSVQEVSIDNVSVIGFKNTYEYGEKFTEKAYLLVEYNNGNSEKVPITEAMLEGFNTNTTSDVDVTINYKEWNTTITIYIRSVVSSIKLIEGYTTKCTIGDSFHGRLRVEYNSGTSSEISVESSMLSGFDSVTPGEKTVTITYQGQTITGIKVLVEDYSLKVVSISVIDGYRDVYFVGQKFDTVQFMAEYSNGNVKEMSAIPEIIDGFDTTTVGEKTVTITFEGQTATFDIVVRDTPLVVIEEMQYMYNVGDAKPVGKLSITDINGTELVDFSSATITGFDSSKPGTIMINIKYGKASLDVSVTINVVDLPAHVELGASDVTDETIKKYIDTYARIYAITSTAETSGVDYDNVVKKTKDEFIANIDKIRLVLVNTGVTDARAIEIHTKYANRIIDKVSFLQNTIKNAYDNNQNSNDSMAAVIAIFDEMLSAKNITEWKDLALTILGDIDRTKLTALIWNAVDVGLVHGRESVDLDLSLLDNEPEFKAIADKYRELSHKGYNSLKEVVTYDQFVYLCDVCLDAVTELLNGFDPTEINKAYVVLYDVYKSIDQETGQVNIKELFVAPDGVTPKHTYKEVVDIIQIFAKIVDGLDKTLDGRAGAMVDIIFNGIIYGNSGFFRKDIVSEVREPVINITRCFSVISKVLKSITPEDITDIITNVDVLLKRDSSSSSAIPEAKLIVCAAKIMDRIFGTFTDDDMAKGNIIVQSAVTMSQLRNHGSFDMIVKLVAKLAKMDITAFDETHAQKVMETFMMGLDPIVYPSDDLYEGEEFILVRGSKNIFTTGIAYEEFVARMLQRNTVEYNKYRGGGLYDSADIEPSALTMPKKEEVDLTTEGYHEIVVSYGPLKATMTYLILPKDTSSLLYEYDLIMPMHSVPMVFFRQDIDGAGIFDIMKVEGDGDKVFVSAFMPKYSLHYARNDFKVMMASGFRMVDPTKEGKGHGFAVFSDPVLGDIYMPIEYAVLSDDTRNSITGIYNDELHYYITDWQSVLGVPTPSEGKDPNATNDRETYYDFRVQFEDVHSIYARVEVGYGIVNNDIMAEVGDLEKDYSINFKQNLGTKTHNITIANGNHKGYKVDITVASMTMSDFIASLPEVDVGIADVSPRYISINDVATANNDGIVVGIDMFSSGQEGVYDAKGSKGFKFAYNTYTIKFLELLGFKIEFSAISPVHGLQERTITVTKLNDPSFIKESKQQIYVYNEGEQVVTKFNYYGYNGNIKLTQMDVDKGDFGDVVMRQIEITDVGCINGPMDLEKTIKANWRDYFVIEKSRPSNPGMPYIEDRISVYNKQGVLLQELYYSLIDMHEAERVTSIKANLPSKTYEQSPSTPKGINFRYIKKQLQIAVVYGNGYDRANVDEKSPMMKKLSFTLYPLDNNGNKIDIGPDGFIAMDESAVLPQRSYRIEINYYGEVSMSVDFNIVYSEKLVVTSVQSLVLGFVNQDYVDTYTPVADLKRSMHLGVSTNSGNIIDAYENIAGLCNSLGNVTDKVFFINNEGIETEVTTGSLDTPGQYRFVMYTGETIATELIFSVK